MTDRNISLRGSSQDRPTYRHTSISIDTNTLTKINIKSENYYSNRNCPEMLSLFASRNKRLDYRVNQIHNSNDVHNFQTINYSIESSPTSPIPNQGLENDKQPMFPKVTPRTATAGKKFPTLTNRSVPSNVNNKNPMPTSRTSVEPISSSVQNKRPSVSKDKINKGNIHHPK